MTAVILEVFFRGKFIDVVDCGRLVFGRFIHGVGFRQPDLCNGAGKNDIGLYCPVTAGFKNIDDWDKVGLQVLPGMFIGKFGTRLGGKMDEHICIF